MTTKTKASSTPRPSTLNNTRKGRTDSHDAQAQAFIDAATDELPEPPAHIRMPPEARPFWADIVSTRARKAWSSFQLSLAAQLARTQYDIERRTQELEIEGITTENARGTPVANPLNTALEALVRRQLALVRALQLAGVGDPRTQANKDALHKGAKQARAEAKSEDDDDLLA